MSAIRTIIEALQKLMPSFVRSDGTIEAKIIDVVGTYADSEALERQNTLNVINDALANQRITTREYYRRKAVLFQQNDTLSYDPINFGGYYANVDPAKQIIKQAFIVGQYPDYTLLVNAVDADGHLRKLTDTELASFSTYFSAFQPLGMSLFINSLNVANITDSGLVVYIRAGVDAQAAADAINANLLAYESTLRPSNTVSLTEIEDVIQRYEGVRAIGWGDPTAVEERLDGSTRTVTPVQGVFNLFNGAFTFGTTITTDMIKILE